MASDKPSTHEGSQDSLSILDPERIAVWRPLGIAASIGAAVGLVLGIFLGRATVPAPDAERPALSTKKTLSQTKEERKAAKPAREPLTPPPMPAGTYVASLGRYLPAISGTEGFKAERSERRPAARLIGNEARLRFTFQAAPGKTYTLAAIVELEGASEARLVPKLDGRALDPWKLSKGWALYSSSVPSELLASAEHDLVLATKDGAESPPIRVDSVALVPVETGLSFNIGAESQGHLVDGFSNVGDRSVWSEGQRSVIAGVLEPLPKPYKLALRAAAYHHVAPLAVTLHVNGSRVGVANIGKSPEDVSWAIPAKVLRPGVNQLAFEYAQTGQPSQFSPNSKDDRALALRYYSLRLLPSE